MSKTINIQELVAHYLQTKSAERTAKTFHITRKRTWRLLRDAGVYKGRTIKITAAQEQGIITAWQGGESQTSIAKRIGLSQCWVGRFLKKKEVLVEPQKASGSKHGKWKGGKYTQQGYTYVWMDRSHQFYNSMAFKGGYTAEHRLVMAEYIGRPLTKTETVHHKNGNRSDNRIDNLQLMQGKHGSGVVCRCDDCGSINIVQVEID